jgi:hypothetical protein
MIRPGLLLLLALAACAGPQPAKPKQAAVPTPAPVEATPAPSIPSDPLLAAMALLKAAKDSPHDPAVARRAASAFLALERDARARGEEETAGRYHAVAAGLDPLVAEAGEAEPAAPLPGPALEAVEAGGKSDRSTNSGKEPPLDGLQLGTYHFSVRISGTGAARSAEAVIRVLEEAYLRVCGAMAVNPDGRVPVVLYTDREFRERTGLPEWVGGAYDGTIHLPLFGLDLSRPQARNVIVHEFVHAFNHQVGRGRAPLWLDEGLAQYFEEPRRRPDCAALAAAADRGGLPALTSPNFLLGGHTQASTLYQLALSAVLCLEDRSSLAAVSAFLQALGSGAAAPQAFQDTFLFPYDRLQAETVAWARRKAR